MPCVTATKDTLEALMALVEQDPRAVLVVDLASMRVTAGTASYDITLPAAAREAFMDGSWDATGLLLENFEQVHAVAARLPYIGSFGA